MTNNQSINEALAYFDATDGDIIKSQNLFAVYDPLIGWHGTLKYLEAGKGYMIKSTKPQTFKYPTYQNEKSKARLKTVLEDKQEVIRPEFQQYSQNMNAIVLLPKGFNELLVHDSKGALKGVTKNQKVNDRELCFITIFGDDSETLTFTVGNDFDKTTTSKTFIFKGNHVLGTTLKPIVLEGISNSTINGTSIYPNPFDTKLNIALTVAKSQQVKIQLFTVASQLVFTEEKYVEKGNNLLEVAPNVAQGVYILQIERDGKLEIFKVIKK